MLKYKLGQKFLLSQNVYIETSTVDIQANKGSEIEIVEVDDSYDEMPYKVYFDHADNWILMSEDEINEIAGLGNKNRG